MRHRIAARKLNRTSSHRKALMHNMATALFEHKKIKTTETKAKELRPFAEKLITRAVHALKREKQGVLPQGQTIDIHNRRQVGRVIRDKAVLQELFDTIAPMVEDRPGGYCRIVKTGFRRGDAASTAIIELVDWSAPQDGSSSLKSKKKTKKKSKAKQAKVQTEVTPEVIEDTVDEIVEEKENEAVETVEATTEETTEEVKSEDEEVKPDDEADKKEEEK